MIEKNTTIYPEDALLNREGLDVINSHDAKTLDELFRERVRRSSNKVAYTQFDELSKKWIDTTWAEMATQVERWQVAFREEGLEKGDRVAICYKNSIEWVIFDQAALRLGLVVVPLYSEDRVDNLNYVLSDSGARLALFTSNELAEKVMGGDSSLPALQRILSFTNDAKSKLSQLKLVSQWLPEHGQHLERGLAESTDLASIVYTSGTTGKPKGVMLSHQNIISNVYSCMRSVTLVPSDRLLSFLPLSHTFERTAGYYAPIMTGASVTYNRSIPELLDDLKIIKPNVLVSVPRIFERFHNKIHSSVEQSSAFKKALFKLTIKAGWHKFEHQQKRRAWSPILLLQPLLDLIVAKPIRQNLGGNLSHSIIGGAPLSPLVAKTCIALGITLLQGYGLTEASPVICVNTPAKNSPGSIGLPLRGVNIKITKDKELLAQGDNIMMGYWNNPQATQDTMDGDWLKTGDLAEVDEKGFVRIIGRIKDILILANGEKVPPTDLEAAISEDPIFEQVMVLGEGKSYLSALVVLNSRPAIELSKGEPLSSEQFNKVMLERIAQRMLEFPGYAKIRAVQICDQEWTVENDLLTSTLKIKRTKIIEAFSQQVEQLYHGHGIK